jgi:hypothetical protein
MSSTAFGAPTYEEPQQGTDQPATDNADGLNSPVGIDPNDPALTSESLDYNPEGDAYASPPPLPDGQWRAKLKQIDVKDNAGQPTRFKAGKTKQGALYLMTALEATIIDPNGKFDGLHVWDRFVSTMLRNDKTIPAATICYMLGKPAPARANHKELMDHLLKVLAGEPEVGIETAWEWSCQKCGEEAKAKGEKYPKSILGMQKFPRDAKTGLYSPDLKCEVNPAHGFSSAQPRIRRYIKLTDLKTGGGK